MRTDQRAWQIVLIVGTLGFSWLGLQAAHEAGHVLHAWASGGRVVEVILRPTTISQTLLSPNPRPQFVAWGGPICGCAIPLVLWGTTRLVARRFAFLARFFAGACLAGNGVYVGTSTLVGGAELDGPVILANGGAAWQTMLFSAVAVVLGFRLWDGIGSDFGLGRTPKQVDRAAALLAAALLAAVFVGEVAFAM